MRQKDERGIRGAKSAKSAKNVYSANLCQRVIRNSLSVAKECGKVERANVAKITSTLIILSGQASCQASCQVSCQASCGCFCGCGGRDGGGEFLLIGLEICHFFVFFCFQLRNTTTWD